MKIIHFVCTSFVLAILSACSSDSPTVETPRPQNLASQISSGALGEDRSILWDCVVFDLNIEGAPPEKESFSFGDDFQGVDSDGMTFTWSVNNEDTIQATYLDISTSFQLTAIKFSSDGHFHGKSTITTDESVMNGQLACTKVSGVTFSESVVFTRISSELEFRQELADETLYLVHINIDADILIDDNGRITGSIVFDEGEESVIDIVWVWDADVNTYCRSNVINDGVLVNYECEYIDIIPGAGVRFTYLNNEGEGAGPIEYWAYESVE